MAGARALAANLRSDERMGGTASAGGRAAERPALAPGRAADQHGSEADRQAGEPPQGAAEGGEQEAREPAHGARRSCACRAAIRASIRACAAPRAAASSQPGGSRSIAQSSSGP